MRRDHHKLTLDHLVWALLRHGIAVRVLDSATRPAALSADPAMDYFQGSVLDDSLVRRLISGADVVVHLAGAAEPMRYGNDPLATMGVNLTGSLNVVRRSAAFGVPVVFSSTSEVYGIDPDLPWREDANRVLGPVANVRWCYSTAKAAVEHYLEVLSAFAPASVACDWVRGQVQAGGLQDGITAAVRRRNWSLRLLAETC